MRNLLLCSMLLTGCHNYEALSAEYDKTIGGDAALSPGDAALSPGDGAQVDLGGDAALNVDGSQATDGGEVQDAAQQTDGAAAADMECAQHTHSNGLGQTWTDCVPLGTYNDTQAMKACMASFPAGPCTYPPTGAECTGKGIAYTKSSGGWTVFVYAGAFIGKVISPGGDCTFGGTTSDWD